MKINNFETAGIFTNNYSRRINGRQAAKELKLPQRTVLRKLEGLCSLGVLKYVREGKNKVYSLHKDNPFIFQFLIMTEAYKAVKFFSGNPKLALLLEEPANSSGAMIFGSYSKDFAENGSDMDVVFLCKENDKIRQIIENSPVKIHPQYSTLEDLRKKLEKNDPLALEIADNHIILGKFEEIIKIFMVHFYGK